MDGEIEGKAQRFFSNSKLKPDSEPLISVHKVQPQFFFQNKCDKYWPPQQGIYGDVEVNVVEVNRKDEYILRILNLKVREMST